MARGLAAIHKIGVCHRDIKPQNLLVDTSTHALKICDFGSAKTLTPGEPNISYICSRYYRAPELMFGSTDYSTAIDVWSVGCVVAELLLGAPLFPGNSGIDQLVEIIKILGTPTREEILSMNSNYREFKFPHIKAMKWENVFGSEVDKEALEVIANVLVYTPSDRFDGLQFCAHEWFDELREEGKNLGGDTNKPLPPLFDYGASACLRLLQAASACVCLPLPGSVCFCLPFACLCLPWPACQWLHSVSSGARPRVQT